MRTSRILLVSLCGLIYSIPGLAAPGPWKTGGPEKLGARLKPGKTLKTYSSPNRRYALLYRDERERGDFVWRSAYLKQGAAYTLVGTYNELSSVRWSRDSSTVSFRAIKAVGPDQMQHLDMEYQPKSRKLRWRVVKTVQVEPSG
jgi:hypothetical protein